MQTLLRYWYTLKYLKPIQIYGRLRFKIIRPHPDLSPPPSIRNINWSLWEKPAERRQSMLGPETFCFLNETYTLSKIGWNNPELSKLWCYNLHYFDDLNASGAFKRLQWHRDLISRWLKENPPSFGVGWEPYPLSLRIVNWIKWALSGNKLSKEAIESLAVQGRWLTKRLEVHLLGNHLLSNAKALFFLGLFFEGKEAERWLNIGLEILEAQFPEQILKDGGHFELSTMYHILVLEDVLDLCNIIRASNVCSNHLSSFYCLLNKIAGKMLEWLDTMCHPDGEISFFNDAAFNIAPSPYEIKEYAQRLGIPIPKCGDQIINLEYSGYIRINHQGAAFFFDAAPLGPDYLLGHAHADTLSFELSLNGKRVIVNSGTSCYGNSPKRIEERGTAAHNTVIVNGMNSSDVWKGFRVARRARPFGLEISTDKILQVKCAHDGYAHLSGSPIHWRECKFYDKSIVITDWIEGNFQCAEARLHLHPDLKILKINLQRNVLHLAIQDTFIKIHVKGGNIKLHKNYWHPEFGIAIPSTAISIKFNKKKVTTIIAWK